MNLAHIPNRPDHVEAVCETPLTAITAITSIDQVPIRQHHQVRGAVDTLAARLAAQRRAQGDLLPHRCDWAVICEEREEIARAIRAGNSERASSRLERHSERLGIDQTITNAKPPRDRMAAPW